jgi:hypothetical protein
MGWMANVLTRIGAGISGAPPTELTFVPSVRAPDVPTVGLTIEQDACYVELYLESMRLTRGRRFATRFHGVVYSFVTLPREGEERASLAAISKPKKLTDVDDKSLDRVITVSKQMMGATAFRGGPVALELGLFSVKTGNLLTPMLDYVTRVSETAGVSFVGAVKPFLPLITDGMDLIAGQQADTELEVGVDTAIDLTEGCAAAIIARPEGSIDPGRLSLDTGRGLLYDDKPVDYGYAAFSWRPTDKKTDYGEIPELKERYGALMTAIRAGNYKSAQDALTSFRLAAIASPDLIPSDAQRLSEKARAKVDAAFPAGGEAAVAPAQAVGDEELAGIALYE